MWSYSAGLYSHNPKFSRNQIRAVFRFCKGPLRWAFLILAKTSQRTPIPSLEDAGRSRLVNLLCAWGMDESEPLRTDWAEQLALWLGPLDAITLQAAQQPVRVAPARRAAGVSLEDDLRRVRDGLLHAMAQPTGRGMGQRWDSGSAPGEPMDVDFASYRQRYQEQQRRMDLMLEPLRNHCRAALSRTNTDLHQLAELDSAMQQTLGERERVLLARLPHWLERRFGQRQKEAVAGAKDRASHFELDYQQLLLAELAFRLEPIEGLVEAFHNRATQEQ